MLFILKKLITPFILPPGLLIVLLGAMAYVAFRKRQRTGGWSLLGAGLLLWLLSMGPMADLLKGGLEQGYLPAHHADADVILMLGGDVYAGAPDLSGTGRPGPHSMARLVTAARLHRTLGVPIVLSGGRVFNRKTQSVAAVARRFLIDMGIGADAVIVEEKSRDTYENALYCKQICDARGFKRPLLVTSGFHLRRAIYSFEHVGLAVTPYPCALTTWQDKPFRLRYLLPSASALNGTAQALHEWIGLFYYRLVYR